MATHNNTPFAYVCQDLEYIHRNFLTLSQHDRINLISELIDWFVPVARAYTRRGDDARKWLDSFVNHNKETVSINDFLERHPYIVYAKAGIPEWDAENPACQFLDLYPDRREVGHSLIPKTI